ncbi:sensor histidine kinase [Pollutibacter soli]|uniref:sensor histidine kinase n=1 Tax=Pollutibacter soli TaxID=3034157 RepID=UPI0030132F73
MKSKFSYAIIVFVVSLATLVILSLTFQRRINELLKLSHSEEQSNKIIIELNRLEHFIKEAESGQRGFLLTGDSSFLEPYIYYSKQVYPATEKIQELTEDDINTQIKVTQLRGYISRRMESMHFSLQSFDQGDSILRGNLHRGKVLMDTCHMLIRQIEDEQDSLLSKTSGSKNILESKTPENFRHLFLVSLSLLLITFALIMREIVQRSRFQRDLQANIIELNQTYEELQQITFITSHDFQEPLRKIRILSSRLVENHGDAEGKMIIDRIQVAATRIQELIQEAVQYMALSRTTEGMTEFNLTSVVNEAVNDMIDHPVLKKADIKINLSVTILGFRSQLRLLFKSLIDNAIKYAHEDRNLQLSITGTVTDNNKQDEHGILQTSYYKVSVADNGIGFEQEFSKKIFQLFKRLQTAETAPDGKGVGLALAEKIMVNHKGYILAEGKPGAGATFHLYFPIRSHR